MAKDNSSNSLSKLELILMGTLALVAALSIAVAVIPSTRAKVKNFFTSNDRQILAKATDAMGSANTFTVLKVKTAATLSLEVYNEDADGNLNIVARLPLYERNDGYVSIKGNSTNLAFVDIDNDGQKEIIAPTYDEQMIPRLNIFKFNSDGNSFDRVTAPEDFKP